MESLKNISIGGLRELKENGFKGLKIGGLKNLIVKPEKPGTECTGIADLEDLVKKREDIKKEIEKLNREKKGIETRIHLIRKTGKEKCEEITEYPWREEIFPPLPRKEYVKIPETIAETPEVQGDSAPGEGFEISEAKDNGMKIKAEEANKKSENNISEDDVSEDNVSEINTPEDKTPESSTPEEKVSQDMASDIIQAVTVDIEGKEDRINVTGKKDEDTAFSQKEDKSKTVSFFSAVKLSENKIPDRDSSTSPAEKKNTESKNNPAACLLGENLIEELLSSDDLFPEEEQGFVKYLQEPEIGELVKELKDIKSLLTREKIAC
ncbi:hypothetical protein [Methanosarcina mazei]|nr:hypothetical protein [Methanosarcina mazei]KKG02389.1 hypothetical protein DU47_12370 [Methanosarcina mazei]KKG06597.1 hypothetical protein DU31_14795 [Methanosarcina mazei]KKG56987.1 hypothetical protein DU33_18935 [Methanosarcina mazei]KKG62570.1 hypothetical protein DU45_18690 [Methanosarcina mazei]KKG64767.1 hypothetical protein DU64_07520 [Methanosarcina mazei]